MSCRRIHFMMICCVVLLWISCNVLSILFAFYMYAICTSSIECNALAFNLGPMFQINAFETLGITARQVTFIQSSRVCQSITHTSRILGVQTTHGHYWHDVLEFLWVRPGTVCPIGGPEGASTAALGGQCPRHATTSPGVPCGAGYLGEKVVEDRISVVWDELVCCEV